MKITLNLAGHGACRQPSTMSNASGMLVILDLVSLSHLAKMREVRYKLVGMRHPKT